MASCLDKEKFEVYVDIEGEQTTNGGTLPPNVTVTSLKPDIVIINKKDPKVSIFELTVPSEQRIELSNTLKSNKYQHFRTDIKSHTVTVTPFEVGSHTGYISSQNKKNLADLHKFCKKEIKLKTFI